MTDLITDRQRFADVQLKDTSPTATVEQILQLLADNGIEVEETWRDTCVPYCYAMSVRVKGTTFSVNGKGLTREFARASGYGELMERLQFGSISKGYTQKTTDLSGNESKLFLAEADDLMARNGKWYAQIAQRVTACTGTAVTAREVLLRNADESGKIPAAQVYCLNTRTPEYYPNNLRGRVYTANGCAAGNTAEETLVQAISEIVERHYMLRIINEDLCLPEIPDEFLKQFETAYGIITFIRSKGYRVIVKDCSMGSRFPVVCVCMIDKRTGRYHTHLGANPVFKIALERSLTESFQGYDIDHVARFEDLLPRSRNDFTSITNEVTQGSWEKSPEFFVGPQRYTFDPEVGLPGATNRELLQQCVKFFDDQGYDILVRDCSCLGFHTYQVIIPGYSECFLSRVVAQTDDLRYTALAQKALRDPSTATLPEQLGLLMHREEMKKFTANISNMHGFLAQAKLSAQISGAQENFLLYAALGYVYHALGQKSEALRCVQNMLNTCRDSQREALICLKRYLSLECDGYATDQIWAILEFFHQGKTVQALREQIKTPFAPYILRCDQIHCHSCQLGDTCCQKRVDELTVMLRQKRAQLDFGSFVAELDALL